MVFKFEVFIRLLEEYKKEYGNFKIEADYIAKDGTRLGEIVRNVRSGSIKLFPNEREILSIMGFKWYIRRRLSFDEIYNMLLEYKKKHNHLNIPTKYIAATGEDLGIIVSSMRSGNRILTNEQIKQLDDIGFIWNVKIANVTFDEAYALLLEYKNEIGNLRIARTKTYKGRRIGAIVYAIRKGEIRITDSQRDLLDEIGFRWEKKRYERVTIPFEDLYEMMIAYKKEHGNLKIPYNYVTPNGNNIGVAVSSIRNGTRKITDYQRKMLEDIGFIWRINAEKVSFTDFYTMLIEYRDKCGNTKVPVNYVTTAGIKLGSIARSVRCGYRKIDAEQRKMLAKIGFECSEYKCKHS